MPAGINPGQRGIPNAHDISDVIDGRLTAHPSLYQFPEDLPKYYTTIKFFKFEGGTGAGGYQQGAANLGEGLKTLGTVVGAGDIFSGFSDAATAALEAAKTGAASIAQATGIDTSKLTSMPAFTNETVVLPLPTQLSDVHKVHWDEKPIVPWVSAISGGIGLGGTDPVRAATGVFGLAPNFFQTMLFDRPEYKRHDLSFKLSPRDFRESTAIRDIIYVINNAMSPGLGAGGFLFRFPNMIQVVLRPNDGWLFKFKPAVIEVFAINYAGGEQKKAFYHDPPGQEGQGQNPPESVEITLHICELEYWLADQFKKENTQ